jgi:hypothetical protein
MANRHGARAILPCGAPRIDATDNLSSVAFRTMWVNSSIQRLWGGAGWSFGWDGCNLDIENHDLGARPGLTELVKELKMAMNSRVPGSHLTFDASGVPSDDTRRNMVFNYSALSEYVDYFVPMYYDMQTHVACSRRSSGCALPSPNSPLPAVQAGLEYWLSVLKIDPSTIIMAVPFYGYDVPCKAGGNSSGCVLPASGSSDTLVDAAMKGSVMVGYGTILNELLPLSSGGVQWNASASSPYFDYPNATTGLRHRVYYDNPRSISDKRELAQRLGLGGISAWTADALPHSSNPAAAAAMWEAISIAGSSDFDELSVVVHQHQTKTLVRHPKVHRWPPRPLQEAYPVFWDVGGNNKTLRQFYPGGTMDLAPYGIKTNNWTICGGLTGSASTQFPAAFPHTGAWPAIADDGTLNNGGVPQNVNMTLFLEMLTLNVGSKIPDPAFAGLAPFDFENCECNTSAAPAVHLLFWSNGLLKREKSHI